LQRYAVERLLWRLEQSPYRDRFILKGAMLYTVWGKEAYRSTRDLDLLGDGPTGVEPVAACFRTLCSVKVADDGLLFLTESVRAEEIRATGEQGGVGDEVVGTPSRWRKSEAIEGRTRRKQGINGGFSRRTRRERLLEGGAEDLSREFPGTYLAPIPVLPLALLPDMSYGRELTRMRKPPKL
jgi:hypothetical protein